MVVGIAIGTFASLESFFEAPIGFLRYIPATALTPVLLLWLGIGESPKIWLIVVGTVFFNILMMADAARNVPRELLNASYTLGAGRVTVLRRVVLRFSLPGIIDAARINLAAAWLMLVVAEVLAVRLRSGLPDRPVQPLPGDRQGVRAAAGARCHRSVQRPVPPVVPQPCRHRGHADELTRTWHQRDTQPERSLRRDPGAPRKLVVSGVSKTFRRRGP